MTIREYRELTDEQRQFAAMYGMRTVDPHRGVTPIQFMAGHFAGLNHISKDEFISVMQGAGVKLIRMGIDCRTPAEVIRSKLYQINRRDDEIE